MYLLDSDNPQFPPPQWSDPDGFLAIGGELSFEWIMEAYRSGIFPWYNEDDPPMWWCPDPRYIILPHEIYISKSMKQVIRREVFTVKFDHRFEEVMWSCANIEREDGLGTWITQVFTDVYTDLHRRGYGHSVEVYEGDKLVGGLYGVALGRCFFGESMFSYVPNASKMALIALSQMLYARGFWLIDCQLRTEHLVSMGARGIPREEFLTVMAMNNQVPDDLSHWRDWVWTPRI